MRIKKSFPFIYGRNINYQSIQGRQGYKKFNVSSHKSGNSQLRTITNNNYQDFKADSKVQRKKSKV